MRYCKAHITRFALMLMLALMSVGTTSALDLMPGNYFFDNSKLHFSQVKMIVGNVTLANKFTRVYDMTQITDHDWWQATIDAKVNNATYFVFAETDGTPHNTITPIARRRGADYELDLVLRNNITTEEHPLGVFHPHAKLHHIKKENIGLIEVMGLAVLPSRLKTELEQLGRALLDGTDLRADPVLEKHTDWAEEIRNRRSLSPENVSRVLEEEVGLVFQQVLEDAGVYKRSAEGQAAFLRFAAAVGLA